MRTVWKVVLDTPVKVVDLPEYSTPVHVETQDGQPTIWIHVPDTDRATEPRRFGGFGTGREIDPRARAYIGTATNVEGLGLVIHVFEMTV